VHGEITQDRFARVSVLDQSGKVLDRFGGQPNPAAPGNLVAPHDLCVDSRGDAYVAEVTTTFAVKPGAVPPGTHTFQKFTRAG
jgi:hypothetical protein